MRPGAGRPQGRRTTKGAKAKSAKAKYAGYKRSRVAEAKRNAKIRDKGMTSQSDAQYRSAAAWGRMDTKQKVGRRKKHIIGRKKRAIITDRPVSMRHEANLILPKMPFAQKQGILGLLSTALYKYSYDPKSNTLDITFRVNRVKNNTIVKSWEGDTYRYYEVPQSEYEGLLHASSKGRYFYYNIRHKYRFRRL